MGTTLVAYVTKTGSTEEIARIIAESLVREGVDAVARPVPEIKSLDGYDAVIVGAPINGMRWVQPATDFVGAFRDALQARPVAVFAVSYMHGRARPMWSKAIEKSVAAAAETTGARASTIFGGRIADPLPGFARLLFGLPKKTPLDLRDPEAARTWARSLTNVLGLKG